MNKFFIKVKTRLDHSLPGNSAQLRMSPGIRILPDENGIEKTAAVLILLFPDKNHIKLAFIKRTHYDGPHSGQISFPGGMKEESDKDFVQTALRETEEETGIHVSEKQLLGRLSELRIPVSNFVVYPFVAYLDYYPDFKPDPVEVDHLIQIPLAHLMKNENIETEFRRYQGKSFPVPYYKFGEYKIWGATAMMLSEFLSIIEGLEPAL